LQRLGIPLATQQAQKNCLQHIFRVARVPRDPVGRAENQTVVFPKGSLEFIGNGDCRIL
jgi:hypothetical protein